MCQKINPKTIYTNVSEHISQLSTEQLKLKNKYALGNIVQDGYQF